MLPAGFLLGVRSLHMRTPSSLFAVLAFVAAAAPAAATSPQQAARGVAGEPQPITVDFIAVTRDGKPVDDVKAADIALRIDGKARPIKSLEFVRFAGTDAAGPLVPAFITNAAPEAVRSFLLIVDDESVPIGQEHKLREAMSSLDAGAAGVGSGGAGDGPEWRREGRPDDRSRTAAQGYRRNHAHHVGRERRVPRALDARHTPQHL